MKTLNSWIAGIFLVVATACCAWAADGVLLDIPSGVEAGDGTIIDVPTALVESVLGPKLAPLALKFMVWMAALRLLMKPASAKIQAKAQSIVDKVAASPGKDDDAFLLKVTRSPFYKRGAWLLDWFTSIKLPTGLPSTVVTTTPTTDTKTS